jgi:hypothetical protein
VIWKWSTQILTPNPERIIMRLVIRKLIDKVCCEKMQNALDNLDVICNEWNFFFESKEKDLFYVIFYCPWCGEDCSP